MIESIVPLLPEDGDADVTTLREIAPVLALRVERTRSQLLERHINDFGPEHLDEELRNKRLVLVLGGGGGAGEIGGEEAYPGTYGTLPAGLTSSDGSGGDPANILAPDYSSCQGLNSSVGAGSSGYSANPVGGDGCVVLRCVAP
jgi:hypothetical protein